jgi:hypothetical protein
VATYSIAIVGEMAGQQVINVLGATAGDAFSVEDPIEASETASRVYQAWRDQVVFRLSSQYTATKAIARGVIDTSVSGESIGAVTAGGDASSALPTFAVAKVVLQSTRSGRAGRGRTGLSGITEGMTAPDAPNRLSAASIGVLEGAFDQFVGQAEGGAPTLKLVVVSRIFRGVKRATPLISAVVSTTVQAELGSRVSRLR